MFDDPSASIVSVSPSPSLLLPRGGSTIHITFSTPWPAYVSSPEVFVGPFPCQNVSFTSLTVLRCDLGLGFGIDNIVTVHLDSEVLPPTLTSPLLLSFAPPSISTPQLLSPFSNIPITFEGSNFGLLPAIASVLIDSSPCRITSFADTQISCTTTTPSPSSSATLVVSIGNQTASTIITFAQPALSSCSPSASLPSNASAALNFTIQGSNFGVEVNGSLQVAIGGIPCPAPVLVSSTRIDCLGLPIPLIWPSSSVVVSFGVISVPSTSLFRALSPPSISNLIAPSFPAVGGTTLRILGEGFGLDQSDILSVTIGSATFTSNFTRSSEFEVLIPLPRGLGTGIPVVITLIRGLQTPPSFFAYDRPALSFITPSTALSGSRDVPFTLCGENLGFAPSDVDWVAISSVRCASVVILNNSCILCPSLESVLLWPSNNRVEAQVRGQRSAPLFDAFEVLPFPKISTVIKPSLNTLGGDELRVIGEGLGRSRDEVLGVRMGAVFLSTFAWQSPFELRFLAPPGVGSQVPISVLLVSNVSSVPVFVSYDSPVVRSVSPAHALVGDRVLAFELSGSNFGFLSSDFSNVTIGGVSCASVTLVGSGSIRCEGIRPHFDAWPHPSEVIVCVAGVCSEATRGVFQTLNRPRVTGVRPNQVTAGSEITLTGTDFGLSSADIASVSVGGVPCQSFQWESAERVTCVVPRSHPSFVRSARPDDLADTGAWLSVVIVTSNGVASLTDASGLTAGSSSFPKVVPAVWIDGNAPTVGVTGVRGHREPGKFGVVFVRWDAVNVDEEEEEQQAANALTGFLVEGRATDGSLFRTLVTDPSATQAELVVSSRLPIAVSVFAQNVHGTGPASSPSKPVLENCAHSHFLATHWNESEWQCERCPAEAVCGGLATSNVTALSGFWRVPWSAHQLGFVACRRPEACLGYEGSPLFSEFFDSNDSESGSSLVAVPGLVLHPESMESCALGHEGVLCANCLSGFFKSPSLACQECGSRSMIALRVLGLVVLAMIFLAVLLYRAYESAGDSSLGIVRVLKIVFNHFQTIAIISAIHFRWPPSVADTFAVTNAASSFSTEGVSLECVLGEVGQSALGRSLVSITAILWMLLFAAAFWAVEVAVDWVAVCHSARSRVPLGGTSPLVARQRRETIARSVTQASSTARERWVRRMKVSGLVLVFLVHTSITKAAFELVTCESVAPNDDPSNTQLRLSMDLDIRCDEGRNLAWMLGTAVPVLALFSLGVPVATFALLTWNRARLSEPVTKRLFGFLFTGFRPGFEGWEGVNMLRKVLLAGVTVVLGPSGAFNQVGAAQLVMLFFFGTHAWLKPYSEASFNRLEMASLFSACLTMLAGMFIEESDAEAVVVFAAPSIIFASNLVFLLMTLKEAFVVLRTQGGDAGKSGKPLSPVLATPTLSQSPIRLDARKKRMLDAAAATSGVRRPSMRGTVNPLVASAEGVDRIASGVSNARKQ